jgi:hypothetical protein
MCPSEIGVQYQPDGRLSTFPKNTATFTGKLLIVPHSHITSAQKSSNDFNASIQRTSRRPKVLEELIALAKDIRAARSRRKEIPVRVPTRSWSATPRCDRACGWMVSFKPMGTDPDRALVDGHPRSLGAFPTLAPQSGRGGSGCLFPWTPVTRLGAGRHLRVFRDRAVSLRLIHSGRHRSISRACEPVHTQQSQNDAFSWSERRLASMRGGF